MRSLFLLLLGVVCGVVGTVLFTTLDPDFDPERGPGAVAVGNVRLSLDEDALDTLVRDQLRSLSTFTESSTVKSNIRSDGLIDFTITVGTLGVGLRTTIVVDPEVVDGRLEMNVVEASLGDFALPGEVAERIEAPLQARLEALAGNLDYRLTAITTADHRLTLEIEV